MLFCVRVRNFRRFSFWANSTTEKSHLVLNSVAFGFADYKFVDREERVTLSFFSPEYHAALEYCGSRTGRTEDKIRNAGLTVACTDDGVPAPAEARLILQCRKLYVGKIRPEEFVDRRCDTKWYPQHDYHEVYIAEIERAYVRK